MHAEVRKMLARRIMSTPRTSNEMMLLCQAVNELHEADQAMPLDIVQAQLQRILGNTLGTTVSARAASMAGRLLSVMDGEVDAWPSSTPDAIAPVGYWPYAAGDDDGFEALDSGDTQGERDAWRARSDEGPPPWRPSAD